MKIAILSPFYPYRGGIAQFSGRLYDVLNAQNHAVKVFSFARLYPAMLFPGKTQFVEAENNAKIVPVERVLDSIQPISYHKTVKAIEKFQPDMLIIAYWMSFFAPAYTYVAKRLRKKTKVIGLLHNAIPHEPKFFDKPLARLFFKQCDYFMVMSDIVKNDLLRLKPNAQFCQTPHPLYDHYGEKMDVKQARTKLGIHSEKKTLLFFGLIRDYKGLDLLIEAMNVLDDEYQLIIAGESYGSFDKYQKQIDQSTATERIKVINRYIGDADIPILFSAADTIVLPYKSATQSGVIPVAYHFEVPVVTTDVGGLKDAIAGAGTGIVCQPTAQSLADGIRKLFASDHNSFITAIRQEKTALSWEKFAEKVVVKPL
ncbi:glycosyltransferase [Candidatus Symbiothrix dinenymphae]|uniref:glycosyltransferase n=1 Tax=Candidatus Symbiothrix dinenymphae TaxID=467085 RepID=UPI0006C4EB39|nr:glycosyltransferase [Candidatus Symbiothrix dinenymphae]GAP72580.1 glycosyltransferase [Candidatus Symbiothrix dinenymphae]